MIETKKQNKKIDVCVKKICDKCKKEVNVNDIIEWQEFFHITHHCGYGSIYNDCSIFRIDLCQHCAKNIFGELGRLEEYDPFNT